MRKYLLFYNFQFVYQKIFYDIYHLNLCIVNFVHYLLHLIKYENKIKINE